MLHLIGIAISLFLSLLLFTKKGRSVADLTLAIWLFLIAFYLFAYYLLASGQFVKTPYLLGLEIAMPFIHGPFLFLYTALLTGKRLTKWQVLLHFVPVILIDLALSKFFFLPAPEKVWVYQNGGIGYISVLNIIHTGVLPSGIAYIVASLFLLQQHRENLSEQVSYLEKINLNWLRNLTVGMCAIWLSVLFGNDVSTFAMVDLFIFFIGYFGIKQVGIFTNSHVTRPDIGLLLQLTEEKTVDRETEKPKYENSTLTAATAQQLQAKLITVMHNEKLFKDAELSLSALAKHLAIHPHALSEVINTLEQKNFYDYINELRIEEFKRIAVLPENQRFTLLYLAYEVGFNSKTAFNRNFKKATGMSPTAYLKQCQVSLPVPS